MAIVHFGMVWQSYGHQSLELPDEVDANDIDAVRQYILDHWDEIPIPEGDYIGYSDELDEEYIEVELD